MTDLVVTVPKELWFPWIAEGDAAGERDSGQVWAFYTWPQPPISPGERLYIVAHGRLRGYAPVVDVLEQARLWAIFRGSGAVAVTIDEGIQGFRGWRRRWWDRSIERPFADWKTAQVHR